MTEVDEASGNVPMARSSEKISSLGFALMVMGTIGALIMFLLMFIGGPSSDSAGYHEGRVFALTETSGVLFFILLGMIAVGAVIYFLTRRRESETSERS